MREVVILRGIPGSGKSTFAKKIAGTDGRIHSTDDLFEKNGVYRFDPRVLRDKHNENYARFVRSLNQHIPVVICDNVNCCRWEFERYIEAANFHRYKVEIVQLPHLDPAVAASRTLHAVPEEKIREILERWEP